MSAAARILAPTLVALLALAAAAKLRRLCEFERTVASFELVRGRGAVRAVAVAVPAIELAAASLVAAGAVRSGALVAAAFVAAATAAARRARDPGAPCGCLSLSHPGGIGRWYLARNGALLALASYVAVLSDGPPRVSGPAVLTALSLTLALLLGESVAHVGSGVPMSRVREA